MKTVNYMLVGLAFIVTISVDLSAGWLQEPGRLLGETISGKKDHFRGAVAEVANTNLWIENACNDVVLYTVEYIPVGSNSFQTKNYTFSPYEKSKVGETTNLYVYISGQSDPSYSKKHLAWNRQTIHLAPATVSYTHTFTCP